MLCFVLIIMPVNCLFKIVTLIRECYNLIPYLLSHNYTLVQLQCRHNSVERLLFIIFQVKKFIHLNINIEGR